MSDKSLGGFKQYSIPESSQRIWVYEIDGSIITLSTCELTSRKYT